MTNAVLNDPTAISIEQINDEPEFVNENTTQKDNSPLLNSPDSKIAVQDSSSSSEVDQDMIQKLLAEVGDYSD
ncbi:hypothetical protein TRFO_13109 [Tritrichomonas foetus]|uniref:Uncharacterized protein n=1 Tax=Tritrichomonas foetus TaxID=1144522 RepID=A0A1J4L070_9EUKA|nr:hypothetical protein TRFO_13109 [Tritrichomonas foetus]|eukprot:OHT16528.1 hypothetical protein TRFO_13109 [Tritrichomonas foetus]